MYPLDVTLRDFDVRAMGSAAAEVEALGFDGVFMTETTNDPFVAATLAAAATERVRVGTAVALAFPRSPLDVAYSAWDLQRLSGGRFTLGLGTQVRAHVERRYSAVWSHPSARMAEFVAAVRAIFSAWESGEPLQFEGHFYRHTLMPPNFRPAALDGPPPPIHVAAVREHLLAAAAGSADGIMLHTFNTPEHHRAVVLPAIERGLDAAGRDRASLDVAYAQFVAVTDDDWEVARRRVAFYGSTPGYRGVLETHGADDLADALHAASRAGDWAAMPALVDDELLGRFCIRATNRDDALAQIHARVGDGADRVGLSVEAGFDLAAFVRARS